MIAGAHAVLWLREDGTGNDACRFADAEGGYLVDGSSTGSDGEVLRYRVRARKDGTTRRARIGRKSRLIARRAKDDTWTLNDTPMPDVIGAKDIDLGFTPATLTLPIRRLHLDVGKATELFVARLDVEAGRLTPLNLVLRRVAGDTYEMETVETGTTSRFTVNEEGIVQSQPGQWRAQA